MMGITSSRAALALSATALFVALGGTALAVSQSGAIPIPSFKATFNLSGRLSLCSRTVPAGSSNSSAARPSCHTMASGRRE